MFDFSLFYICYILNLCIAMHPDYGLYEKPTYLARWFEINISTSCVLLLFSCVNAQWDD
jgi:hypothetical protein